MKFVTQKVPYFLAVIAAYYLLPLFGKDTGSFMLILLVLMPIVCFASAFWYGIKRGLALTFPLIIAILFVPSVFLFYNYTAWVYAVVYGIIGLIGNLAGGLLFKNKQGSQD